MVIASAGTMSHFTGFATLLANRDARTEVTSFQVYNFKMRAQIGTSNVEN
jgi:hypothetical protein